MRNKLFLVSSLLIIASMVLAGCARRDGRRDRRGHRGR